VGKTGTDAGGRGWFLRTIVETQQRSRLVGCTTHETVERPEYAASLGVDMGPPLASEYITATAGCGSTSRGMRRRERSDSEQRRICFIVAGVVSALVGALLLGLAVGILMFPRTIGATDEVDVRSVVPRPPHQTKTDGRASVFSYLVARVRLRPTPSLTGFFCSCLTRTAATNRRTPRGPATLTRRTGARTSAGVPGPASCRTGAGAVTGTRGAPTRSPATRSTSAAASTIGACPNTG
jgi:hypothetical protein